MEEKEIMNATVKWYDRKKLYGFLKTEDGKDLFFHRNSIQKSGSKYLDENDLVEYDIETDSKNRKQAINIHPILTRKMIEDVLKKENLYLRMIKDANNETKYLLIDENNMIQTREKCMTFLELAEFTGFTLVEE